MFKIGDVVMVTTNDRHWWICDIGIVEEISIHDHNVLVNFANNERICKHGFWWVDMEQVEKFPESISKRLLF